MIHRGKSSEAFASILLGVAMRSENLLFLLVILASASAGRAQDHERVPQNDQNQ